MMIPVLPFSFEMEVNTRRSSHIDVDGNVREEDEEPVVAMVVVDAVIMAIEEAGDRRTVNATTVANGAIMLAIVGRRVVVHVKTTNVMELMALLMGTHSQGWTIKLYVAPLVITNQEKGS